MVDLSATNNDAAKQAIFQDFERKKMARNLAIPTDDAKVRQKLRELGEPRVYFAETVIHLLYKKKKKNECDISPWIEESDYEI